MTAIATGSLRGGDAIVFYPVMRFVTAREQEVRFQVREGNQDPSRYGVVTRSGSCTTRRTRETPGWTRGSVGGATCLTMVVGPGLVVLPNGACGCFDRRGEPLDVQRSRTGLRRTLRAERLVGHHATSIITGAKIVGVASGRDLCPRAHDGACRSDIVGRVVLPAPGQRPSLVDASGRALRVP